jgi:endonuclease YncB( thermonuclease family)
VIEAGCNASFVTHGMFTSYTDEPIRSPFPFIRVAVLALAIFTVLPLGGCRVEGGTASAAAGTAPGSPPIDSLRTCVIVRVVDGDTIVCAENERVRLLLIDTPESTQPPFGQQASNALHELLAGHSEVRLEMDAAPLDQYGRTLAYLWLPDGTMINEEMAREGFAVALVYPPNVQYVDRIRAAVDEARSTRRGLWSIEGFSCEPVAHRRGEC